MSTPFLKIQGEKGEKVLLNFSDGFAEFVGITTISWPEPVTVKEVTYNQTKMKSHSVFVPALMVSLEGGDAIASTFVMGLPTEFESPSIDNVSNLTPKDSELLGKRIVKIEPQIKLVRRGTVQLLDIDVKFVFENGYSHIYRIRSFRTMG